MSRVAYTVICHIENQDEAEKWLKWLRDGHIGEVMKGGAESAQIVRLDDGKTCEIRYIFPNREIFDSYIADHAPRLRAEGLKKFPQEDGFSYSRTIGEIL